MRMPGRTRGETRAMQDSYNSMGLKSISDQARLANQLANREAINEAVDEATREHGLPSFHIDLSTAPANELSAPLPVAEAEASEHAEIWRGSRSREFRGLLQAHTFGPV